MARNFLVLHVGDVKTGSTSIQAYLRHFHERDPASGLWSPAIGDNKVAKLKKRMAGIDTSSESHFLQPFVEAVRKGPAPTIAVLSNEALLRRSPGRIHRQVAAGLEGSEDWEVRVIAYIRPHVPALLSRYQQSAKASATTSSLAEYVDRQISDPSRYNSHRLERIREVFGDRLIARPFVRSHFPEGDVVRDFCAQIETLAGVDLPRLELERDFNTALAPHEIAVSRFITERAEQSNLSAAQRRGFRKLRRAALVGIERPVLPLQIGCADMAKIRSAFAEDARKIDVFCGTGELFQTALAEAECGGETTPLNLGDHFSTDEIHRIRWIVERGLENVDARTRRKAKRKERTAREAGEVALS